jgi:hypothetical protein
MANQAAHAADADYGLALIEGVVQAGAVFRQVFGERRTEGFFRFAPADLATLTIPVGD